jgi:hypothetical protein
MPKNLYKTTIVIWTDANPQRVSLEQLAQKAEAGDAYCSKQETELVKEPEKDETWDGTEFFGE